MDVILVHMPFGPLLQPSIGLSLLKGQLGVNGIKAGIKYYGLKLAEIISPEFYAKVANMYPDMLFFFGEWIFSVGMNSNTDAETYLAEVLEVENNNKIGGKFKHLSKNEKKELLTFVQEGIDCQRQITDFVESCKNDLLREGTEIFGFTSTFQQNLASLSLARALKESNNNLKIIFGGANCEGIMGQQLLKSFPFIDIIVSGQAEMVITPVIKSLLSGNAPDNLAGVHYRDTKGDLHFAIRENTPSPNLNELPLLDYDDFFSQYSRTSFFNNVDCKPVILYETSRGCWWGERHHCTFCGLNGATMAFNSKAPDRVIEELVYLVNKYPNHDIAMVDNILDMKYFKTVIPELAKQDLGLKLFYEVKANINFEQLVLLKKAGILEIQPGIESFSDNVLQLMDKGVKAVQNIRLLKWCKELGIKVFWNIIWGFPGETEEDYLDMVDYIDALNHFDPPDGFGKIRMDRFSPNYESPEKHGFTKVAPVPAYKYIYDLDNSALGRIAYYFSFDYIWSAASDKTIAKLRKKLCNWRNSEAGLFYFHVKNRILIFDYRNCAIKDLHILSDDTAKIFHACRNGCSKASLVQSLNISEGEIETILSKLIELKLIIELSGQFLALPIRPDLGCEISPRFLRKIQNTLCGIKLSK